MKHVIVFFLVAILIVLGSGVAPTYAQEAGTYYTVRAGDTLIGIAARHGVSVSQLARANGLRWNVWVYVGQRLIIPNVPAPSDTVYSVQRGDTLYRIALRFGTTVRGLMVANNLRSSLIYAGQHLVIPGRNPIPVHPAATISPTSGPAGTLVQVTASGFPANTPVSVGVGPANSEFGEVGRGTIDANGSFTLQVPIRGATGMDWVFGVSAGDAHAVSTPFHITGNVPSATSTPLPPITPTPTPTPYTDMWTTFSNLAYAISLQHPADWQPVPGYGSPETGETRFAAVNGFFQIGAMDAASIDDVAAAEAGHRLQPYGSEPTTETLRIQGQEARLILPSADQPTGMYYQAALIVQYPQPVKVVGTPCRYFVLWADWPHIRTIAQTLRFTN